MISSAFIGVDVTVTVATGVDFDFSNVGEGGVGSNIISSSRFEGSVREF